MKQNVIPKWIRSVLFIVAIALLPGSALATLTVTVVDDGGNPISDFRWILQEDNTAPGVPGVPTNNTVSIVVHKSQSPVIATGHSTTSSAVIQVPRVAVPTLVPPGTIVAGAPPLPTVSSTDPDPTRRYVLSVMASGYSMGGQLIAAGQASVRIVMNRNPLPTTQISVLVFHDHLPLDNEPDAAEEGLAGFRIEFHDLLGGPMIQDAFGNPIGTDYATNSDGSYIPDPTTKYKIQTKGNGYVYTDKDGKALIKNMWNGKFGVEAVPPTGENWNGGHASMKNDGYSWQTATIEGTPVVDAWGAANGAKVFIEGWGAGYYHVFFGFCDPGKLPGPAPTNGVAGVTLKGRLRVNHYGRPPLTAALSLGPPVTDGWVGLNIADTAVEAAPPIEGAERSLLPGNRAVWAQPCDPETGEFVITNVAPGSYQLVSWDRPLDFIWNSVDVNVPVGGDNGTGVHDMGDVRVVRWFGSMQGSVFYDANGNGFPDADEEPIPSVPLNIRFRDGTMYQSTQTKFDGTYSFTEIFPFFKWLVAEIDNGRWKSSGVTAVVDDGGTIPPDAGWALPSQGVLNPQLQYAVNTNGTVNTNSPIINTNTGNAYSRTQTAERPSEPVLTQAIQVYSGQYERIDWGKANYGPGESGGISGIVSYNNTRAEADPRYAVQELWDPGMARVQVVLYQYETNYAALAAAAAAGKQTIYGDPYDINFWKIKIQRPGATTPRLADVDNYPFSWSTGGTRGPEDVDRDDPAHSLPDAGRVFNPGDAIQITHTDCWDDDVAAQTDPAHPSAGGWPKGTIQQNPPVVLGRSVIGSDNFATWNQVRPGVFDGAYVLNSYHPGGIASGSAEVDYLPPGDYIVQAVPPPGYFIQTEESRNIVFGDAYTPSTLDIPPECVGDFHFVPPYLSLFQDQQASSDFANQWRPLADRKLVTVIQSRNAPCSFNMYSEVPKAARVVGFVLQDLSPEFDPANPTYGEKEGASWIPISFRDWAGQEVARTYADEYGCYEAMLPSTYNAAVPCPSGFAPNMLTVILNDPSMPDPANPSGPRIPDPNYNPAYTVAPVVLEYFPGVVKYADTPVVPIGAFVGGPNDTLDVEPPSGTPVIASVVGTRVNGYGGPWVRDLTTPITITSRGPTSVLDPTFRLHGTPNRVLRDYGFGTTPGTVTLNGEDVRVISWSDSTITFNFASNQGRINQGTLTPTGGREWQLMVRRSNGRTTPIGITLSYEPNASRVHVVQPVGPATVAAGTVTTAIQDAIDAASNGDLVIVPAISGAWNEYLVMYRPIRLQGSGLNTVINGVPDPQARVSLWHEKITSLLGEDPFVINECPGVEVLGQTLLNTNAFGPSGIHARIDGFQFKGAIHGGGINLYNRAPNMRISNNRIIGNMGDSFNAGMTLGAPAGGGVEAGREDTGLDVVYENENVIIEYNQIFKNSSLDGAGGIAVHTGATGYKIRHNFIMGNFTFDAPGAATALAGSGIGGGGILHMGLSPGGLIADNVIAFNEVYFGYSTGGGDGAGILIQGESDGGSPTGTSGSGSVTIVNNLIQGNLAGAGLGGGIRLAGVNGPDIDVAPNDPRQWYEINIFNNIIVNNAAGFSGGGISIQDAIKVNIINNTIANNDAAAVALNTFPPDFSVSVPQGAGIVSHPNTEAIPTGLPSPYNVRFSNPVLRNDIIWHNRSFKFDYSLVGVIGPDNKVPIDDSGGLILADTNSPYVDLYVVGGGSMNPVNCFLSSSSGAPNFATPYINSNRTAVVYDEGGNGSLSLRFEPISLFTPSAYDPISHVSTGGAARGDYHLRSALGGGTSVSGIPGLGVDYDGQSRTPPVDRGADEFVTGTPSILPDGANANLAVVIVGPIPDFTDPTLNPFDETEPQPESNPSVPPGPQVAPPPINPVWMTTAPDTNTLPLFVAADIQSLTAFALRLKAQGDTVKSVGAQAAPVAKNIFVHLSGEWPVPADPDGDTPPPLQTTKGLLAVYTGGTDPVLLGPLVADLNTIIQSGVSIYDVVVPPPTRNPLPGYTPSSRTTRLAGENPVNLVLLNRSVIQDAFTEIRRWYDPLVAYMHLVCGDGFAEMADGTELYVFGFSDQTAVANNPGNDPSHGPDKVFAAALANASISAPTIVVKQDQDFHLDLSNVGFAFRPDLFDSHTVHFHGFPQAAPIFDGMPLASVSVREGSTFPYFYKLNFEGTYFYHCHEEATEHMQQGMIGNLYVLAGQNDSPVGTPLANLPPGKGTTHQAGYKYAYNDGDGSTYYDVEYPIQITGFDHYFHDQEIAIQPPAFDTLFDTYPLLNGRGYPDTIKTAALVNSLDLPAQQVSTLITATQGQRILLRISSVSETEFDTLTVPGIPMTTVGKDARLLRGPDGKNLFYRTTSITVGGGETTDVILDTANTKPGTYVLYAGRLTQLSNDEEDYGGMMTYIVVSAQ